MAKLRFARWWLVALAICLSGAPVARAGVGFQPATPEELKMTSEPLAPGAPAIILYRQVARVDGSRTGGHEDNYFRIKILTEEGRKYADVEIPFLKDFEDIVSVHARSLFEHPERVHPIYFEYPRQKKDDLTVELPPGWQVASVPDEQNINAGAAN